MIFYAFVTRREPPKNPLFAGMASTVVVNALVVLAVYLIGRVL